MRASKTVSQSETQQVQIIMPRHVNSSFRLFGGELMQWIDVVAGVVARLHSGLEVTTAAVDHLEFLQPAKINDMVRLDGRMVYAGRTSMEVCVDTYVLGEGGEKRPINRALLTMVALDKNGKPAEVPLLVPETDEQRADYAQAETRRASRRR